MSDKSDELAVLFPDVPMRIGGQDLTVRELRFAQQIQFNAELAALADELSQAANVYEASPGAINTLLDVLINHWPNLKQLVAASIEQDVTWIEALSGDEGEALLMTWWTVNRGFFVRRLMRPNLVKAALAGDVSLLRSSSTDTQEANLETTPQGS